MISLVCLSYENAVKVEDFDKIIAVLQKHKDYLTFSYRIPRGMFTIRKEISLVINSYKIIVISDTTTLGTTYYASNTELYDDNVIKFPRKYNKELKRIFQYSLNDKLEKQRISIEQRQQRLEDGINQSVKAFDNY